MTLGMAVVAFCFWIYWTVSEVGVWGFLVHTFGPKGGLKGVMKLIFAIIFLLRGSHRGGFHSRSSGVSLRCDFLATCLQVRLSCHR